MFPTKSKVFPERCEVLKLLTWTSKRLSLVAMLLESPPVGGSEMRYCVEFFTFIYLCRCFNTIPRQTPGWRLDRCKRHVLATPSLKPTLVFFVLQVVISIRLNYHFRHHKCISYPWRERSLPMDRVDVLQLLLRLTQAPSEDERKGDKQILRPRLKINWVLFNQCARGTVRRGSKVHRWVLILHK